VFHPKVYPGPFNQCRIRAMLSWISPQSQTPYAAWKFDYEVTQRNGHLTSDTVWCYDVTPLPSVRWNVFVCRRITFRCPQNTMYFASVTPGSSASFISLAHFHLTATCNIFIGCTRIELQTYCTIWLNVKLQNIETPFEVRPLRLAHDKFPVLQSVPAIYEIIQSANIVVT
jgi:hypothetical protein